MTATGDIKASSATPKHGDTLTVTYVVAGNDGTPDDTQSVHGAITVGGQQLDVAVMVTIPGTKPLPVTYGPPLGAGLTFAATKDPAVWTAIVP